MLPRPGMCTWDAPLSQAQGRGAWFCPQTASLYPDGLLGGSERLLPTLKLSSVVEPK